MTGLRTSLVVIGLVVGTVSGRAQSLETRFSLSHAIAQARARAPGVRAAEARAGAAERAADVAGQWRAPTLDLSIENLGPQDLDHDGFLWITQPLDVGPRRSTRLAYARASSAVARRSVDVQRRTLDTDVVDAYLAVVRDRATVDLLAAHEGSLAELVSMVQRRLDQGVVPEGDLRKLEAERARAATAGLRATVALRQHALRLSLLTGEPAANRAARVVPPPSPPLPAADATASARHPEVLAAEALVDERRTAAAVERALAGMAFAVAGGYKRTSGFDTGAAGISVDLPIGSRNKPAQLRAEAEVIAATLELDRVRDAVDAEMSEALATARLLGDHAAAVDATMVAPAAIALRAAQAAYREGTGDVIALVDAGRVHLDTRREAETLRLDAVAAAIRARLALGEALLP